MNPKTLSPKNLNPKPFGLSCAAEGGIRTFYKGIVPRTLWISLGGCVFFGSYESVKELLYYAL